MSIEIKCVVRKTGSEETDYLSSDSFGLDIKYEQLLQGDIYKEFKVTIRNNNKDDFSGVINFCVTDNKQCPQFYMPGYMYNNNTAFMPSSGRKAFPRLKENGNSLPESEFFMTRSDRLAEPLSLIYDEGHVYGVAAVPYFEEHTGIKFNGFTCNLNQDGKASVGFTLGYENAPWLFVQTATVLHRAPLTSENSFKINSEKSFSFNLIIYDYSGDDENAIYKAIIHSYERFYQAPRTISGMTPKKAAEMLSSAIRDNAWLEDEKMYTGFVYDKPDGATLNKIGSLTWTNGLSVAAPMLITANKLKDDKPRLQALEFINQILDKAYNQASGLLYEAVEKGKWSVYGWWYNGMHSGGHSGYLNGQAVYYIIKCYLSEKQERNIIHRDWIDFVAPVISKMNSILNSDFEYPFAMSEKTGAGIEYDSLGSAWCLAATLLYEKITGDTKYLDVAEKSEFHYYNVFVKKLQGYGGPLDTDKAVDSEGVLSYIRAVRILHEITHKDYLLDHLRDGLYYEYTFKLGYNTPVQVPPLSQIGWSSCGGSITSTANPHIHPMSSTITGEMDYYLKYRKDTYVEKRLEDTINWSMQTFNTKDKEYGYGKTG